VLSVDFRRIFPPKNAIFAFVKKCKFRQKFCHKSQSSRISSNFIKNQHFHHDGQFSSFRQFFVKKRNLLEPNDVGAVTPGYTGVTMKTTLAQCQHIVRPSTWPFGLLTWKLAQWLQLHWRTFNQLRTVSILSPELIWDRRWAGKACSVAIQDVSIKKLWSSNIMRSHFFSQKFWRQKIQRIISTES